MHQSTDSQRRTGSIVAAFSIAAFAIAGCTTSGGSPSPGGDGEATTVAVTLQEWAVVPSPDSAPAGDITFAVTNDGPVDIHEIVVLKTDLDPGDLPTDENGAVIEEGIEVIDEIEDIPVGESQELSVTLDAGSYVLLCNIYDAGEDEAHYAMGMLVPFTVTE